MNGLITTMLNILSKHPENGTSATSTNIYNEP